MSKTPDRADSAFNAKTWIIPGIVMGTLVAAAVSYTRSAEIQAAAGSPYYSKAVREALSGLQNPGEQQAIPAPALPAGLSPEEHYWCEQCKAYHKRQPGGGAPGTVPPVGGAAVPAVGESLVAAVPAAAASPAAATPAVPAGGPEAIPPLPEGFSATDYYWCVNCKTYHSRSNPQESVPGAAIGGKPDAQPKPAEIPPTLARPAVPPPAEP